MRKREAALSELESDLLHPKRFVQFLWEKNCLFLSWHPSMSLYSSILPLSQHITLGFSYRKIDPEMMPLLAQEQSLTVLSLSFVTLNPQLLSFQSLGFLSFKHTSV